MGRCTLNESGYVGTTRFAKPDSSGLVPATREHGTLRGAACCATRGTLNGVETLERGAVSRATSGSVFIGGRDKPTAVRFNFQAHCIAS
jgi:hypothetical protein